MDITDTHEHAATQSFVEERLRRPSSHAVVIAGSTPVVSFGNPELARAATLGLNPSRVEFLATAGRELTGHERRLETLASLGVADLHTADHATVHRIVEGCNNYFTLNPYRRWFDQLDRILQGIGASYYDGSACHLDLVQWATDPVWGKLTVPERRALLHDDWPFLQRQLDAPNLHLLLLNGRSVLTSFHEASGCELEQHDPLTVGAHTSQIYVGCYGHAQVIGWSTNLQSSFGVTNAFRGKLRETIAALSQS